jgi:hypothetical protein
MEQSMTQDEQNLNLLSVFHYVVGGLTALLACVPFIHLAIGIAMLSGAFDSAKGEPPPHFIGIILVVFAAAFILAGWTLATVMIIAGRKLRARKSRTFCIVVAGIECAMMPFGTVLGVFTIVLLMKDSVKPLFEPAATTPDMPLQ